MQVGILEFLPSSQHVVFAGMSKTKQGGWDMMRAKCHQLGAKCHQCNFFACVPTLWWVKVESMDTLHGTLTTRFSG